MLKLLRTILKAAAIAGASLALFVASANAEEWSTAQIVSNAQTLYGSGAATYYIYSASGWGASGCPNAATAYIYASSAGAAEILALAMESKRANKNVQIWGTCTSGYFLITALYLES